MVILFEIEHVFIFYYAYKVIPCRVMKPLASLSCTFDKDTLLKLGKSRFRTDEVNEATLVCHSNHHLQFIEVYFLVFTDC